MCNLLFAFFAFGAEKRDLSLAFLCCHLLKYLTPVCQQELKIRAGGSCDRRPGFVLIARPFVDFRDPVAHTPLIAQHHYNQQLIFFSSFFPRRCNLKSTPCANICTRLCFPFSARPLSPSLPLALVLCEAKILKSRKITATLALTLHAASASARLHTFCWICLLVCIVVCTADDYSRA